MILFRTRDLTTATSFSIWNEPKSVQTKMNRFFSPIVHPVFVNKRFRSVDDSYENWIWSVCFRRKFQKNKRLWLMHLSVATNMEWVEEDFQKYRKVVQSKKNSFWNSLGFTEERLENQNECRFQLFLCISVHIHHLHVLFLLPEKEKEPRCHFYE